MSRYPRRGLRARVCSSTGLRLSEGPESTREKHHFCRRSRLSSGYPFRLGAACKLSQSSHFCPLLTGLLALRAGRGGEGKDRGGCPRLLLSMPFYVVWGFPEGSLSSRARTEGGWLGGGVLTASQSLESDGICHPTPRSPLSGL